MRLTKESVNLIISALDEYLKNSFAELRLYGSRVRDDLKGGDIDLLLLLDSHEEAEKLNLIKHYIISKIKKNIGDQKIDLIISDKQNLKQDSFLQMILPKSIILKTWKR